ncbi:hypothetical protein NBG84_13865 [Streptomyces sp. CWNU-1]|uniref:Uncharacterized protein n=2 Tax=Streptomyces albipurpureus TaxID=2897419 RepID=A0ABT0ULS0_9ACTN|nr:hypothetical protein [Streptomyces sp. CWNU-1]
MPLAEAERRAGFRARVPTALGHPDAVSLTAGPGGRSVVSLCWSERGQTVRLDEFRASLDLGFAKQTGVMPEWVTLRPGSDDGRGGGEDSGGGGRGGGGSDALWFKTPHALRLPLTDAQGSWTPEERTAGPTLLWSLDGQGTTLRLEGVASLSRAVEIAESTLAEVAETDASEGGTRGGRAVYQR